MRDLDKLAYLGGDHLVPAQKTQDCQNCDIKCSCKYRKLLIQLKHHRETVNQFWEKISQSSLFIKDNLKKHISGKQELYWPLFISGVLMLMVLASKIIFPQGIEPPNHLPLEAGEKIGLVKLEPGKVEHVSKSDIARFPENSVEKAAEKKNDRESKLREDIAGIVKNTPMEAMVEPIARKPRPVAAFLVGIAMKESKFGAYSPKLSGRDCYNYWGFKGGGKTVSGGYTCFSSPEEAVDTVGGRIEKLVNRGVKNPNQMISWKCGSSCAGHGEASVRKWIADVGIYFYKINS